MRLQGKVALITGGASGMGLDWAHAFVGEGARIIVADVAEAAGTDVVGGLQALGHEALFVPMDVTDEAAVRDGVTTAIDTFGRIDVLCNGAGVMHRDDVPVEDLRLEVWNRILAVNLTGTALAAKYVTSAMKRGGGGSIINTSSALALAGAARSHAYVAAKGGVLSLTRAMAAVYARDNIRVNAICPGIVETPMTAAMLADDRARDRAREWHLLRRLGTAADVTPLVVYLASDESLWMTGAGLPIDGGATAS